MDLNVYVLCVNKVSRHIWSGAIMAPDLIDEYAGALIGEILV